MEAHRNQSFTAVCAAKKSGDRCNCFDRPTPCSMFSATMEVLRRARPTSQISICRSGRSPEEPTPKWRPHVPTSPAVLRCLQRFVHAPAPRNYIPSCSYRNFGRQRFSEFLTASLSRRRSRVRAPSSPPFPFQRFPSLFRYLPRYGSRRHATSIDTKCPQYSDQTVALDR
jgi:hypothetical protein